MPWWCGGRLHVIIDAADLFFAQQMVGVMKAEEAVGFVVLAADFAVLAYGVWGRGVHLASLGMAIMIAL